MPSDRSAVEITSSTGAVAPALPPRTERGQRTTLTCGGGSVVCTCGPKVTVALCPAAMLKKVHRIITPAEIGRASCRQTVQMSGGVGAVDLSTSALMG